MKISASQLDLLLFHPEWVGGNAEYLLNEKKSVDDAFYSTSSSSCKI